jgi:hypothetical protein
MKNTKLELIELMESLGAKPQAHGDYIVWELDSKNLKCPQASKSCHPNGWPKGNSKYKNEKKN